MKSSRERMRKDEMQLTISLIPLAIESNRLFPSEERGQNQNITYCKLTGSNGSVEGNSVFFLKTEQLENTFAQKHT